MRIENLLKRSNKCFPVINPLTNTHDLLRRMVKEDIQEAPVIHSNDFLGLLNRSTLFGHIIDNEDLEETIFSDLKRNILVANPGDDINLVASALNLDQFVIPILDDGKYIDAISREELLQELISEKNYEIMNYKYYINSFGSA